MTQPIELAVEHAIHGDGNYPELHPGPHGSFMVLNLIAAALEAYRRGVPPESFHAAADVLHAAIRRTQPQVMP